MRLITLEFNTTEDVLETVLQDFEALNAYWTSNGVRFHLFQDTREKAGISASF